MSGAVEGVALLPCPYCDGPAVNVAGEYITCGSPVFISCAGRSVRADLEDWNTRTTPPARSYADGVEDAAKVAEEQTRLNAQARRDRADDALAFEFQGLGDVITAAIRLLPQGGKA